MSTAARYVRGEWTALVTEHGTALLHPLIDEERVRGVWDALREGTGVSGCLEVLAADGLIDLPAFALVQHGDGEFRVLVRGEATITSGEATVSAAGIATWREALIPAQSYRVVMSDDGAGGSAWPLAAGIVLASAVECEVSPQAATEAPAAGVAAAEPARSADSAEDEVALGGAAGAGVDGDEGPAAAPEESVAEPEDEAAEESATEDEAAEVSAAEPEESVAEDDAADGSPEEYAEAPTADPSSDADPTVESDELEQEAPPEMTVEAEQESGPAAAESVAPAPVGADGPAGAAPSLHADGGEIIDSLPWAVSAADRQEAASQAQAEGQPESAGSEPEPSSVLPASEVSESPYPDSGPQAAEGPGWADDLPEHTVLSSHAPNAAAQSADAAGSAPAPPWQVPADMSLPSGPVPQYGQGDLDIDGDHDGHTVMVSELPKDQDMTIAPGLGDTDLYDEPGQPPAGAGLSLSVSTGAELPLDRPVLIGRAPESARFSAGVQPRLVTVPSPEQDISRTHVEIRAEGSSAVVTDLNSTNGTVVIQPEAAPRRLHAGEGASVPVGTLIDLGDGVTAKVHTADQGSG